MGVLSFQIKPNFMGLFKLLNNMNWLIVFLGLINLSVCIYEDQIGKFDWRQSYVGRIKFAQFDTVSTAKKIIVATEENVLAALHLKTGQVVWRHVFESASPGNIQLLHVSEKVVSVSGSNPYLVRGWDSGTGVLLWEWSMTLQNEEQADYSEWFVQNNMLVHLLPVFGSHIEVTMYNILTGQNKGSTSKLPAQWINDGCILTSPYYTCASGGVDGRLISLDVTSNAVQIITKPLASIGQKDANLRPLDGNSITPGFILNDKKIVLIKNDDFVVLGTELSDESASATVIDSSTGPLVLQTWSNENKGFNMVANSVESGAEVSDVGGRGLAHVPEPELCAAVCARSEPRVCRVLLAAADDAAHLLQQTGRIVWTREEALANVVAVEFVDLPVSDLDAAIESEFDQKEGSIWAAFSRRLQTQLQQLQTLLQALQRGETARPDHGQALVRDYFNLHKIIVLVTDVGKIFGMDNLSGALLWSRFVPALDTERALVFTRREARHPPYDAYVTVLGRHEETGNGLIVSVNPVRGTLVGEGVLQLDAALLQAAVLHTPDDHKLHALLLLDHNENVLVFPETAAPLVKNMYMYVAERDTGVVRGYALRYQGQKVVAQRTWVVRLGGGAEGETVRVVAAARVPAAERSATPGRVLPDRSVLYKHHDPNRVLIISHHYHPTHKDSVVALCVDAASGGVVAGGAHRRAAPTALAAHSDNTVVYVYYSDKMRRYEIATMELYEGKQRLTAAGQAWSSFGPQAAPAASARQAYVLPATPRAAALTATERGLTNKHLLLGLSTGAIVEIPWLYLDPRRPVGGGGGEEGLPPYAPELPLAADAVINYNRSLARLHGLYTAPAGLESTSLVLATGLDLFYTRVAPSKTFDLLKDDFDYYLIALVLGALLLASSAAKYFAARKMLRNAWK